MILDNSTNDFEYLRISLTDRCNLRCLYCMPPGGVKKISHSSIISYEEILKIVRASVKNGVFRVRVTGGEPLVRKGVENFISRLREIPEIKDLSLTTNGVFLMEKASDLVSSGLMRVNISLDSLNPDTYKKITRCGELSEVLIGIFRALEVGLNPVKINVVLIPGMNDSEILDFADFAFKNSVHVRFIEKMPFAGSNKNDFISQSEIINTISTKYFLFPESNYIGGGPAKLFSIENGRGKIGFISSHTQPFCSTCKRLRLSAEGFLMPCLDARSGVFTRGKTEEELTGIIRELGIQKRYLSKKCAEFHDAGCFSLSSIGG
ncbi:MAG: GTP 3',8-cyclase MoaA [Candidatus Riflebacteria bacterium]|nr:GTP 3',8-cyclase MoaA [Candidatus Riflebacteria bacterium]